MRTKRYKTSYYSILDPKLYKTMLYDLVLYYVMYKLFLNLSFCLFIFWCINTLSGINWNSIIIYFKIQDAQQFNLYRRYEAKQQSISILCVIFCPSLIDKNVSHKFLPNDVLCTSPGYTPVISQYDIVFPHFDTPSYRLIWYLTECWICFIITLDQWKTENIY
jgi:hypothetical protein